MALQVSEAIAELTEHAFDVLLSKVSAAGRRFREAITPTEDIEFTTRDGRRFTGVFVLSRGKAVAMLAVEVQSPSAATPRPMPVPTRFESRPETHHYGGLSPHDESSDPWERSRY
jgi:hypothetical protein